jgi:PAS domain S-box-containing protein/putative nucleotidyltransferase with HDIG domain
MANSSTIVEPQTLYELCWTYAPGSMFAFDVRSGEIIDANPAAEKLTEYRREELLGMDIATLHPAEERERVREEFLAAEQQPSAHPGFHLQSKLGRQIPVKISSSELQVIDRRTVVIYSYIDITDSLETDHRLSAQNWALSAYASAALALGKASDPASLFQAICEAITKESAYALAWIGIAGNDSSLSVRTAAAAGKALGYLDGLHVTCSEREPGGQGPVGVAIRTKTVQIIEDTETSAAFEPWREQARQFGIRCCIAIPFRAESNCHGALMVYAARPRAFEPLAVEVFEHLAEQIGHGLHAIEQDRVLQEERAQLSRMEAQLTMALSAMVAPIVQAMEMRDPYTVGHQGRVAEIAVAIGQEMGWSEDRLRGLRVAALVHDIGKISIPAEILTKPGMLSDAERAMINQHAENGYTILKDIPFPWPIAEIVHQHHEKLDGSGYPRGLNADAMLPEAKVLAVADVVEAMASYRPYRPGVKLHLVLRHIQKLAGTELDAEAVRICVALFRDKHFMLSGWIRN